MLWSLTFREPPFGSEQRDARRRVAGARGFAHDRQRPVDGDGAGYLGCARQVRPPFGFPRRRPHPSADFAV